jgi:glycosyltransferase involved in cell wall biosynthesis
MLNVRILFVTPYFYPAESFGGPVKAAFDVGRELVKRGHEVTVFTSDARDLKNKIAVESDDISGMRVYYFRNWSMFPVSFSKLFITPELPKRMNSDLKSFDIIHAHEYTTYQNAIVHRFAKKYGVPYVLQVHGSLPMEGRKVRKWLFEVFFGRRLLRDASKVIALSQAEADQYQRAGVPDEKISIVPNGIDLSEYRDLPSKGAFKEKFGINCGEKIVLYLGRIHWIKGIDLLVKAFANVVREMNGVRLVVVGPDDGYLAELEALIKSLKIENNVLISGPLYGKDKLEVYVDADLYVLPSRHETFPIGLLEAYACEKPVISSMVEGLNNLVIDNVTGFLVNCGDAKQLSCSIMSLLDDNCRAKKIGLGGKQFVKENFTVEKVADRLETLYNEVAEG